MKRLFVGMEVLAPWEDLPEGRVIAESDRHITLKFLGNVEEFDPRGIPKPDFNLGCVAYSSEVLFLSNVVAYDMQFFDDRLMEYQKHFGGDFLPHVSVARSPKNKADWQLPMLPFVIKDLHLYESCGDLKYKPIWTYELIAPLVEIPHTADIAFIVRGTCLSDLLMNAQVALCFAFPELLPYIKKREAKSFEDVVIALNKIVTQADLDFGSPLKAVSFAGNAHEKEGYLEWEMILDI